MNCKFWIKNKLIASFILLVFLSGCVAIYNPATGRKEWYLFDEQGEISWGNAMANEFIKQNKIVQDPEKITYLKTIGEKVARVSHRNNLKYHFYIIDEDQMNAMAIPGGHIFIYKGLLNRVSQQELAFVLAHEIGHISARHSLKKLGASLGFNILAATLLRRPEQATAKQMVNQLYDLVAMGYSRSDELQADSLGFDYVLAAGYNPKAAISLFEKFIQESKKSPRVPIYLKSHPHAEERIKNIESKLAELKSGGDQ